MSRLDAKQINAELNSLALYFANREIMPDEVAALCASAAGGIIGRNRNAGVIDDATAEQMLQSAFEQMRVVAFAGADRRN